MDNNSKEREAFMRLHAGLPRQGPGSDVCTAETLGRLPALPADAKIFDLGCGPGRASLVLAYMLKQKIVCVDKEESFLEQLRETAKQRKLDQYIETRCGDMATVEADLGSIDLIWSEGAIYCVGFDRALESWRPLLSKTGMVACTELSWFSDERAPEAVAFWKKHYPEMRSVAENLEAVEWPGYTCIEHFTIPDSCWWSEYYDPLEKNIEKLKADAGSDEDLKTAIANAEEEIDIYRKFGEQYGYEFYLLQK
jgi:serine/threonine-protein kinase HipA